jgi:DNA-binding MurR/RpiR family transcriptional regulator
MPPVAAQNVKEFSREVSRVHADLSPNFLKIADYILANPDEVALSSMRAIAGCLDLDPSNLVRFAKFMSFSGYPELRALFQADLRQARTEYSERARHLQNQSSQDKVTGLLGDLQTANTSNLDYVFEHNTPRILKQAARILLEADRIFIMGMRSCFPAAFSLHYICRIIRTDVNLSSGHGGTFADDIRSIGPDDVFVVIGTHPYTTTTVVATEYAAKCGAKIVALTDSVLSPLAVHAHTVLSFKPRGTLPLIPGSTLPIMALVEALTAVMVANGGDGALEAIRTTEKQLHEFSAYSPDTTNTPGAK